MDFGSLIPVVAILATVAFAAMAVRLYQLRMENRALAQPIKWLR